MPEQITQKLGFDASAAITSLTNLNRKLGEFRQGLQATSGGLRKFEASAVKAVATFNTLGRAATKAAASINTLRTSATGAVPTQISAQAAAASAAMSNLGASATGAQAKLAGIGTVATAGAASMGKLSASATAAASSVRTSSASMTASANKTAAALTKTGVAGEKAATTIGISWKTIGRIILAQVVIRGLSMLVSAFNDAQEKAREFSLRIGEISTIAGGALGSIDEISDATLELSRSLGLATSEVAEGLYQTLSNQVVEAGEAIRFETTAAKLSITTHSQLKESINALSSIMNSYQLDISEAEEVSAVLFKTIELGRLRMGEFGDVLGRVSPLTAALGIEYKEMAAALAAITQKGVPAHTAITQLTAVTQKLLRPTVKLQELYTKWGVETGPEAIERFGGLRGVLLKMRDATAGNDKEFADLLGRVRSMVGAMNLTTNGADALTKALGEMEDPLDDLDAAFARMESTIGRRSVKAWDDLDVSLHKAGKTFLDMTTPMVEVLGTLVRNFDLVAGAAFGTGIAIIAMKTSMVAAITTTGLLTAAVAALQFALFTLGPIALAAAGVVAAIQVGKAIADTLDTATGAVERYKASEEAMTKALEAQSKARIDATKKEVAARKKLILGFVMDQEALIKKSTEIFQVNSEAITQVLDDQLSEISDSRSALIQQVEDAVRGMDDAISDSEKIVAKIRSALSDASFEKSTRSLAKNQKAWAANERAAKAASRAAAAYANAGASEEGIKKARELFKLAEKKSKASISAADASGNSVNLFRAEKQLASLRNQTITSELRFQNDRKSLQAEENVLEVKNLKLQQEKLHLLQAQKAEKVSSQKADGTGLKTAEQRAKDLADAKALDPLIAAAQEGFNTTKLFGKLGLEDYASKLRDVTEKSIAGANIQFTGAAEKLQAELKSRSYLVNVNLSVTDEEFKKLRTEKFGEGSPFDSKTADQNRKLAEGVLADSEKFTEEAAQSATRLTHALNEADANISSAGFHNWLDEIVLVDKQLIALISRAKGVSAKDAIAGASPAESFRKDMQDARNLLKQAKIDKRELTKAERDNIAALDETGRKLEANGELSDNQINKSISGVRAIHTGIKELDAFLGSLKKIPGKGVEKQSRAVLKGLERGATNAAAKEKALGKEVDGVKNGIKATTDESKKLPSVIDAGTVSMGGQADEAGRLKTNVQGAATAQERLNQLNRLQRQPPTATTLAKPPETPAAPAVDTSGIEAGTEALKPLIKGIKDVKESTEDAGNNFGIRIINGTQAALPAIETLDTAVITLAGTVGSVTAKVGGVTTSVGTTSNAVVLATENTGLWSTAMGGLVTVATRVTLAMQAAEQASMRAARAAALAASAAGGGGAGNAFHGGPAVNYRAVGGPATRGQDTIPVMASPGEFFMNARSSRRFSSELQAMNAGREPIFRDKGGAVTNVGDINVSVTQGETASNTARQIASSLRRELRRGTSRL